MLRRQFLAGSGALLAAPSRIRIAFLGASHPHASPKVFIAQKSADWDLVGVYEPDAAVMERYAKAGIRSLTRAQILDDRSIAVVAVESDIPDHASDARAAFLAGKHVHWEKQPAVNMAEFRATLAIARARKLIHQMGYMWRHNPAINAALEAARNGWLGEVFQVRGTMHTLLNAGQRKELGRFPGGQMFDLAGHMVDPIVRLMGRPERVTPVLQRLGSDGLADNTLTTFEWKRAVGSLHIASMQPRASAHRTLELVGTLGTAVVRPVEPPSLNIDLNAAAGPYKAGPQTVSYTYTRYVDDFAELAAVVRGERKMTVTAEEELLVQETLLRASGMEV